MLDAAKAFIKYDNDDYESFEAVDWLFLGQFNGAASGAARSRGSTGLPQLPLKN